MRRTGFRDRSTVPSGEPLEPLRTGDLTMLAGDCGPAPMNLGAVLLVDGADDGTATVPTAVAARAARVPRLTQVLVDGSGGPAWWRDPAADPPAHVTAVRLRGGGEAAALDDAATLLCTPLDPGRPLWAARWLTGWDDSGARRGALVVVLHHVLVDGIGGLGILAALADPARVADDPAAPASTGPATVAGERAAPSPASGGADRPSRPGLRAWCHGLLELGLVGVRPPALAARTSLNRPTGPRRRVDAAAVPLAAFRAGAHRDGGSVNDAVVAAVVGTLAGVLRDRGEHPATLVASVPVSGRAPGDRQAGNDNGVVPVAVPTRLPHAERVRHVAAATARRKARPRGRSALPLGAVFRALATLRVFRAFVEHQRLVHTFVTNVRGPAERLSVAGREVSRVVPMTVNPGNVGASFAVLSYAGELVVTVVSDPAAVPDPRSLTARLAAELDASVQVTA